MRVCHGFRGYIAQTPGVFHHPNYRRSLHQTSQSWTNSPNSEFLSPSNWRDLDQMLPFWTNLTSYILSAHEPPSADRTEFHKVFHWIKMHELGVSKAHLSNIYCCGLKAELVSCYQTSSILHNVISCIGGKHHINSTWFKGLSIGQVPVPTDLSNKFSR